MRAKRARCADPRDRGIGRKASEDSEDELWGLSFFDYDIMNICYGVLIRGGLYHWKEHTFA
jgi:hypothetical protein